MCGLCDECATESTFPVGVPDAGRQIAGVDGTANCVVELLQRGSVGREIGDVVSAASVVLEQREPIWRVRSDGGEVTDASHVHALGALVCAVVGPVLESSCESIEVVEIIRFEDDHGEVAQGVGSIFGGRGAARGGDGAHRRGRGAAR